MARSGKNKEDKGTVDDRSLDDRSRTIREPFKGSRGPRESTNETAVLEQPSAARSIVGDASLNGNGSSNGKASTVDERSSTTVADSEIPG